MGLLWPDGRNDFPSEILNRWGLVGFKEVLIENNGRWHTDRFKVFLFEDAESVTKIELSPEDNNPDRVWIVHMVHWNENIIF